MRAILVSLLLAVLTSCSFRSAFTGPIEKTDI